MKITFMILQSMVNQAWQIQGLENLVRKADLQKIRIAVCQPLRGGGRI